MVIIAGGHVGVIVDHLAEIARLGSEVVALGREQLWIRNRKSVRHVHDRLSRDAELV